MILKTDLRTGNQVQEYFIRFLSIRVLLDITLRLALSDRVKHNLEKQTVKTGKAISGYLVHVLKLWMKLK